MAHKKSKTPWEGARIVHPNAAGLDIGAEEIYACVPPDRTAQPVRSFGTTTPDLHDLANWLASCGVDTVAMESTGVYWIPAYEILEARKFQVWVVNARHLKNVPGRKTDVQDCQWIQQLHTLGFLNRSFRPEAQICVLRSYLRQRAMLIEHRAAHIQHMQKALQLMNVRLTSVVKDITGVTGMAIIRHIVAGERSAAVLVQYRDPRCKKTPAEFIKALTGNYRPEHLFALSQALALYDDYTHKIRECDVVIEREFSNLKPASDEELPPLDPSDKSDSHCKNGPRYDARSLLYQATGVDLVAIRGLNVSSVQTIISEVGTDMGHFPTEKHFCSWLGLAPHNDISGGKVLRARTLKNKNRAGQAFRLAAQSVSRSPHGAFGAFYRYICRRLGKMQAIVATAHKIARTFYYLLKHRIPFKEYGSEQQERRTRERELRRLETRARELGLALRPLAPAPAGGSF